MSAEALKTLFHPFQTGDLAPPAGRVLFLGAEPGFRLPEDFTADLSLVQGFRPWFKTLAAAGYGVTPTPEGDGYDAALVLIGKHRSFNELQVAEAITRVKPGGLVVVAGATTDGAASLRDALAKGRDKHATLLQAQSETAHGKEQEVRGKVPLLGSLSKYHGIAFWFEAGPQAIDFAAAAKAQQAQWPLVDGRFRTAPGMFSWDHVDRGSALLAEHLPDDISGRVADFGAGWGYLSASILERCPAVASLDLYEADFASVEASKANVSGSSSVPVTFHWQDLTSEPIEKRFHVIVMNPPFHAGRAAEPALGQAFIAAAARALKPKGRLLLVANSGLSYERTIGQSFTMQRAICRREGFKVIEARR